MAPTHAQAAARLSRLRAEFAELRAANRDGLADCDVARCVDLKAEISVLSTHVANWERFEAQLARSGRGRNGAAIRGGRH
jgi:hypothetical protein